MSFTQCFLRTIWGGMPSEQAFSSVEAALDEAISHLKNGASTPVHIRLGDTIVYNYMDIIRESRKK